MKNDIATSVAIGHRNLTKAAQVLIGICTGIVADGVVNEQEIAFLRTWLAENANVCSTWPGNMIARRIDAILADGVVTVAEQASLLDCLQGITGNHFTATGVASGEPADTRAIPFDEEPYILFKNRTFCFTGTFYFGTRSACERAVMKLEGIPLDNVTQRLDYLVVGSMASPDWINTSYGRKIEAALTRKSTLGTPSIISEQSWSDAMATAAIQ